MKKILSSEVKYLAALLLSAVLSGGCISYELRCPPNYIMSGSVCCLDRNNNSICDMYEVKPSNSTNQTLNRSCIKNGEFIEFYGAECPHCMDMAPLVSQIENETGVNFTKLEVWHNESNSAIFNSYKDAITENCGFFGVPTFLDTRTNRSICGETNAETLRYLITVNSACQ